MYNGKRVGMIIPAAGIGSRMGGPIKKQYLAVNGKALLRRTLDNLVVNSICDEVILVVGDDEVDEIETKLKDEWHISDLIRVVSGGANRQQSVKKGLCTLEKVDFVFIHDGVRPFAKKAWLSKMIEHLESNCELKGISVGKQVTDTLKEISEDEIVERTLKRESIWAVQTPQLFWHEDLLKAHRNAEQLNYTGTDDASLIEKAGGKVKLLYFGDDNIKITTPFDLLVAKAILDQDEKKECND